MSPEATVVERCEFCSFVATGPLEQARRAFAEHECGRPKPEKSVSRRSGFALRATRASALPDSSDPERRGELRTVVRAATGQVLQLAAARLPAARVEPFAGS
jgi:hypothetical protein